MWFRRQQLKLAKWAIQWGARTYFGYSRENPMYDHRRDRLLDEINGSLEEDLTIGAGSHGIMETRMDFRYYTWIGSNIIHVLQNFTTRNVDTDMNTWTAGIYSERNKDEKPLKGPEGPSGGLGPVGYKTDVVFTGKLKNKNTVYDGQGNPIGTVVPLKKKRRGKKANKKKDNK
jgi:hypothetical protein